MMRKLIIILLIFSCFSLFAQKEETQIVWSKGYKLTWDDFQGKPKSGSTAGAITSSGIGRDFVYDNGLITLNTKATFNKKKSWVKENAKITSVLGHEQGHFNITELYARKFRKAVLKTKFKKDGEKAKNQLLKIYDIIDREWDAYQDLYDKETDLSREESKQKEWLLKIAQELEELEAYSNPEIVIDLNKKSYKK